MINQVDRRIVRAKERRAREGSDTKMRRMMGLAPLNAEQQGELRIANLKKVLKNKYVVCMV